MTGPVDRRPGPREAASSRSRKEELRAEGEAGRAVWFFSRWWWCECWREGQRVETAGAARWGPQVSVVERRLECWGGSQPDWRLRSLSGSAKARAGSIAQRVVAN